jgi:pyruvate,orthophosphate dikinase
VKIAVERAASVRPDLKLGICGEHGGDPASIHFCESVGLDYVSCSPYRVPIARLAAAQAAMAGDQGQGCVKRSSSLRGAERRSNPGAAELHISWIA